MEGGSETRKGMKAAKVTLSSISPGWATGA